jgi:hypothetical protein
MRFTVLRALRWMSKNFTSHVLIRPPFRDILLQVTVFIVYYIFGTLHAYRKRVISITVKGESNVQI